MINGTRNWKITHVHSVAQEQQQLIRVYLQGHVYDWCKSNGQNPFKACDMIGSINKNWAGTPLQVLYDHYLHRGRGEDYAYAQAARSAGWLLWQVLVEDNRDFRTTSGYRRSYTWTGN